MLSAALINVSDAGTLRDWWTGFCERHLLADDPYQFEQLTVDQLVDWYHLSKRSGLSTQVLVSEMRRRLVDATPDDREILTKTIAGDL